jgi:hypothetical protein
VAAAAVERIAELYAIEQEIRGRLPEERREIRNTRSRPLLESLKQWLEETLGKLSRKSDTALAVRYALGRWEALLRYCDDGRLEIDNNAAERSLRAVVLGRKNCLVSKICGLISVPEAARGCDIGLFPWHRRYEIRRIVWSPLEFYC